MQHTVGTPGATMGKSNEVLGNSLGINGKVLKAGNEVKTGTEKALNYKLPDGSFPFAENLGIIEESFKDNELNLVHVGFRIGNHVNEPGQNLGSLKVLAYAAYVTNLTVGQTLRLFSEHYESVLNNPNGSDHKNIRALQQFPEDEFISNLVTNGKIKFDNVPLAHY